MAGTSMRLARLNLRISQVFGTFAVIALLVMLVHIITNAVMRTAFDNPIPYTLELVEYWYMPLVTLLGFVVAQQRGEHIVADLLFDRLARAARKPVEGAAYILAAAVCAGVAWFSFGYAEQSREIGRMAGLSDYPAWPVHYVVPLTFATLALQFVLSLTGLVGKDVTSPDTHTDPAPIGDAS